jgi:hypothetical protein
VTHYGSPRLKINDLAIYKAHYGSLSFLKVHPNQWGIKIKPRTGSVFWSARYKCYVAKISATHPITGKVKPWERHAETSKEAHDKLKDLSKAADKWLRQEAPESLDPLRMTFEDLAKIFEKKKLVKAKYVNGRKISGRRDLSAPKALLASLREYFRKRKLADLKHSDLEDFKSHLPDKPVRGDGQRSMAAINRELEFLRTILNFAVTNGYLEQNPFHAGKGKPIIDRPAENKWELSFAKTRFICVSTT